MIKNKQNDNLFSLEKLFTRAGLPVIVVAIIANLYSLYVNHRFVYEPIDMMYYLRYIIVLGGGFLAGYFFTNKSLTRTNANKLFSAVFYAALAISLYALFEIIRTIAQHLLGQPDYPWGKLIFEGQSVLATIATFVIAYSLRRAPAQPSVGAIAKATLIIAFVIVQVVFLIENIYYAAVYPTSYDSTSPLWLAIISYMTNTLVLAAVAYLVLRKIKQRFDRLFYAVFATVIYSTLSLTLWEFRTDASQEATIAFSMAISVLSLLFFGVLLWRARKLIK